MDPVPRNMSVHQFFSSTASADNENNKCAHDHASTEANEYHSPTAPSGQDIHLDEPLKNSHVILHNGVPQVYEVSEDRRKRRKLSQELVLDSEQPSPSRANNITVTQDMSSSDSIRELSDDTSVALVQPASGYGKEEHQPIQFVATSPKPKRRGRPPKTTAKGGQSTLPLSTITTNVQSENSTSNLTKPKTTPKKATMKIGADGKLFEPSRSPPSNTASKTTKVKAQAKSGLGGKNLTLKNGKLTQKLVVTLRYSAPMPDGSSTGTKIDEILSQKPRVSKSQTNTSTVGATASQVKPISKSTHPFFLAKAAQQSGSETPGPGSVDPAVEAKKPIAWKDLVFKSNRASGSKDINPETSIWPPLQYQHVGAPQRLSGLSRHEQPASGKYKSKSLINHISDEESILSSYIRTSVDANSFVDGAVPSDKLQSTAANVLIQAPEGMRLHTEIRALSTMRTRMLESRSPFDRAEASGPYPWTQQYSPSIWEEILQSTSYTLFEWLSGLGVHNVKQGLDSKQTKQAPKRRKRLKKRNDEFADFIDFDDESQEPTKIKNAILLVGPNGCGKTASVFTVAKQLGFEVFEIHSGMRRSQKDIFEKVGDMTQNHMVQAGQNPSRDSSVLPDTDLVSSQEETAQPSLTSFLMPPSKKNLFDTSRSTTPQPNKQSQKQSLILFEEVDHVFEDDRGFWSGVQALIQNSKRPVVLTCNDLRNVPLSELDLYATLVYTAPHPDVAAEYLYYMAAAEGHVIRPDAIHSLYQSKGYDLRATITELQFWCQMTVGSTQGGLDWFPLRKSRSPINTEPSVRTFSIDTFRSGLDLLPVEFLDTEEHMKFASQSLDIACDALLDLSLGDEKTSLLDSVATRQALDFFEARSDAECMHLDVQPVLYSTLAAAIDRTIKVVSRHGVTEAKIRSDTYRDNENITSFRCFDALAVENSIHSLGHARLAPSLDSPRSILACDIAPYIRSTVSYDQRLEQQRDEAFSSQGKKSRTTRAARAAAEGGDKASTRRERWFPESLNLQAVLGTGNNWPQWPNQEAMDIGVEMDVTNEADA